MLLQIHNPEENNPAQLGHATGCQLHYLLGRYQFLLSPIGQTLCGFGSLVLHRKTNAVNLICDCFFSLGQVFWAIGTVFEVLLAVLVMPTLGWRWLLILSALPLLLFAVLCFVGIFLKMSLKMQVLECLEHLVICPGCFPFPTEKG